MTTYIVTAKGPIDGHQPGTDVTAAYAEDVRARLVEEGYIEAVDDKPKASKSKSKKADAKAADEDSD